MTLDGTFKAIDYISGCALASGDDVDAGRLALAMVCDDHSGLLPISLERYFSHLDDISKKVGLKYRALVDAGSVDDVGVRMAALKGVVGDEYGYVCEDHGYEVLELADMIRVIDLGKASSEALGILYMDAARKCGWQVDGIDVASHFLCRMEHAGERQIFYPAQGCKIMQAHDLRALVKDRLGADAELSSEYLEGMGVRRCIVHLCNGMKYRRIEMGEYKEALEMISRMRILVPDEHHLLLDAGVLYARIGQTDEARVCLEEYIDKVTNSVDRYEAQRLLDGLD